MPEPLQNHIALRCTCGSVELEAIGAAINNVVCYCEDCRQGALHIEALPNAPAVRDSDGGTAYLLYRKDRVKYVRGDQFLQGYRLEAKSPTSRIVATCCNSAMFLNFEKGHWLSVYRARFPNAPPVQMRIFTKFRVENGDLASDAPSYANVPFNFMAKLVAARIAMLLRR